VGNASQKPKKKACEEIVACPNCHPMWSQISLHLFCG
jgi:hypothetical protein